MRWLIYRRRIGRFSTSMSKAYYSLGKWRFISTYSIDSHCGIEVTAAVRLADYAFGSRGRTISFSNFKFPISKLLTVKQPFNFTQIPNSPHSISKERHNRTHQSRKDPLQPNHNLLSRSKEPPRGPDKGINPIGNHMYNTIHRYDSI